MKIHLVAALAVVALATTTTLVEAKTVITPSAPVVNSVEIQALTAEIDRLKSVIAEQQKQISQQQGVLSVLAQKGEGISTALLTAAGVILASILAGFFAIRNQNNQAAQGRLLKAVELIMDSRSGYQADIRRQNLAVFLDATTKEHLKDIKTEFAGPEFTDIHLQLAESMASKAQSPKEALEIWQAVLKEKNVINKVKYP
jgi:hypothetical protein